MAEVCFENYDPAFRNIAQDNDVIVAGYNFGCGSSVCTLRTYFSQFVADLKLQDMVRELGPAPTTETSFINVPLSSTEEMLTSKREGTSCDGDPCKENPACGSWYV